MLKQIFVSTILLGSAACQNILPSAQETLSAGDLIMQYHQSKTNVRNRYDGKEIVVRGYAEMEPAMPNDDDYEGLILLGEKDGEVASQVLCWFSTNETEEFSKIKGGQHITVKGIFNGELGAELKFCKLLEIE